MFKSIASLLIISLTITMGFFTLYLKSNSGSAGVLLEPSVRHAVSIPKSVSSKKGLTYEQELELFSEQLARAFGIPKKKAQRYAPVIIHAEINTGLSEIKIASLIMTESSFNDDVESSVGAYGSTQIRPIYWEEFCDEKGYDIFSFDGNVLCGATIVAHLMDKYCSNDLNCALEHYNVGRGNLLTHVKYRQAGKRYSSKVEYYSNQLSKNSLLTASN